MVPQPPLPGEVVVIENVAIRHRQESMHRDLRSGNGLAGSGGHQSCGLWGWLSAYHELCRYAARSARHQTRPQTMCDSLRTTPAPTSSRPTPAAPTLAAAHEPPLPQSHRQRTRSTAGPTPRRPTRSQTSRLVFPPRRPSPTAEGNGRTRRYTAHLASRTIGGSVTVRRRELTVAVCVDRARNGHEMRTVSTIGDAIHSDTRTLWMDGPWSSQCTTTSQAWRVFGRPVGRGEPGTAAVELKSEVENVGSSLKDHVDKHCRPQGRVHDPAPVEAAAGAGSEQRQLHRHPISQSSNLAVQTSTTLAACIAAGSPCHIAPAAETSSRSNVSYSR